jgi:phi LC3 family holin
MIKIDWKSRINHKAWWISMFSLTVLLLQQLGLAHIADYIPKNYADIINTVFAILAAVGIAVDTSTPTLNDKEV